MHFIHPCYTYAFNADSSFNSFLVDILFHFPPKSCIENHNTNLHPLFSSISLTSRKVKASLCNLPLTSICNFIFLVKKRDFDLRLASPIYILMFLLTCCSWTTSYDGALTSFSKTQKSYHLKEKAFQLSITDNL